MAKVGIAAGSQIAAAAGAEIANQGGNAVDAALAAALVSMSTDLGVMAPGAGGFITLWPPAGEPVVIDAYAEVPGRGLKHGHMGQGAFEVTFDYGGPMSNVVGYGAVATPGIFAGLGVASERYGLLPWRRVVDPAIRWVEEGFPLTGGAAEYLRYTHEAIFSWHPDSYRTLHHADGSLLQAGERVHIPELGASLRQIAEAGWEAFYTGDIGQRMAAEVQNNGGLLTAADLAAYRAICRSPLELQVGEWTVITNPPPAIGGACLGAMLLLLDHRCQGQGSQAALQTLIEVQRAVLDYRTHRLNHAVPNDDAVATLLDLAKGGNARGLMQSPSTIHVSAVDDRGWACSITASAGYGSGAMVSGTGLWLNNSLGEVDLHPQGIEGLSPGTRLSSNMAPTIARHADGTALAIGSPGASRITTAITQVLHHFIHNNMDLASSIAAPRLHVEVAAHDGLRLVFEPGLSMSALDKSVLADFELYPFADVSMYFGGVQASLWHPQLGIISVADSRRAGGAAQGSDA